MKKIKKLLLLLLVLFIGVFGNKNNTNILSRKNARIINNGEIYTDNIADIQALSGGEHMDDYERVSITEYNLSYDNTGEFHFEFLLNQTYNNCTVSLYLSSAVYSFDNVYISMGDYQNPQFLHWVSNSRDRILSVYADNYPFNRIVFNVERETAENYNIKVMITSGRTIYYEYEPNERIGYTLERYEEELNQTNYENNYNPLISAVENINNTELVYWSYNGYIYNSETKSQRITISPVDNNGEQAQISMSASNTTTASDGPAMTTSIVGINTILQAGYFDFLNWRDYFEDITFYIGDPFNEFLRFKVVDNTMTSGLRIETDATGNNTLITYQMNENDILRNNRVYISQDIISRFKKTNISNIRLNYKSSIKTLSSATKYFTIATNMIRTLNEEEETYFNAGYNSGLVDGEKSAFSFEWIKEGVRTAFAIFDMKLAGDITLGNIIFIPLVIGALVFIIKIALKGGGD